MTAKRFKPTYDDGHCVFDKETDLMYHMDNEYITVKMADLLNEFADKNEQLKQQMQTILKLTKKIEDCTHDMKLIGDVE